VLVTGGSENDIFTALAWSYILQEYKFPAFFFSSLHFTVLEKRRQNTGRRERKSKGEQIILNVSAPENCRGFQQRVDGL